MAKWKITPSEAFAQMLLWDHSVDVTRSRILADDADSTTRQVDAQLFAMAVRQVLRFADLVRATAPKSSWSGIDKAINKFNATSPDAKTIRDVLDHWDAYMRGEGDAFPAGKPQSEQQGRPDLQIADRPTNFFYERGDATYRLHITPAPDAPTLVLDVTRDAEAIEELTEAIGELAL